LRRDGYQCQGCGVDGCRLHVHHVIPRSDGGTDDIDNLQTLCPDCHAQTHGKHSCLLCGSLTTQFATWTDRHGGAAMYICEDCVDYCERGSGSDRCVICARFKEGRQKSDGIIVHDEDEDDHEGAVYDYYSACDQCRVSLLSLPWPRRQEYLDDHLPDSHVNVRHWEVSE
jgi:hypothetical protein